MTKYIAFILALLLLLPLIPTCAEEREEKASCWIAAEDPTVTEERSGLFFRALGKLVGAEYTPVLYLGSLAGEETVHCYICRVRVVVPNAVPKYMLVYVSEDSDGNAQILSMKEFDFGALLSTEAE